MAEKMKKRRVTTPEFRFAFSSIFKPTAKKQDGSGPKMFHCKAIFSKDTDITAVRQLVLDTAKDKLTPEAYAKFEAGMTKNWPEVAEKVAGYGQPFRDGDEKTWDGFKNSVYAGLSTKFRPAVVDRQRRPFEPDAFHDGMYGRASLTCYFYPAKDGGVPGFALGMENIQILRDGEALGGGPSVDEVFDDLPETSDDGLADL